MRFDPDLAPIEIALFPAAAWKRWKGKCSTAGRWMAYPENDAREYTEVFELWGPGNRVRFVARGGTQYGPELPSPYVATCWAFAHGWRDPDLTPDFNVRAQVEVRCNMRVRPARFGRPDLEVAS